MLTTASPPRRRRGAAVRRRAARMAGRRWRARRRPPQARPALTARAARKTVTPVRTSDRVPLSPDLLPGQHALAKQPPAHLEGGPMIRHLLCVPAAADAEKEAATRQSIHSGD